MDDSESSPSPLDDDTPVRSRRDSDQPRRVHRSSKDRDRMYMGGSSRELARLLVYQEREAKDLRKMLATASDQLKAETQRADEAEMRAREAAIRFKTMHDAKTQAQQDTERHKHTLELYRLQLRNAQTEIDRAQQIIDSLETQRMEAEEVAARARTTARKLKEEKLATLAREEGRREGYEEGLAQGRNLGFEEGRAEGYARGRAATARSVRRYADELAETPVDEQSVVDEPAAQQANSGSEYGSRPPSGYVQSLRQGSPGPERARSPGPSRVMPPGPMPAEPPKVKDPDIRPIPVNYMQSPGHPSAEFTPDTWIPKMDEDGRIRLPPQHEMGPAPPTPSPPPSRPLQNAMDAPDDRPPLMVPPPGGENMESAMMSDSDASTATAPVRPRHRRRRSTESQSTTMSQFEILGPPAAPSGRNRERPHVLSAIAEERERSSSMSSPSVHGVGSPFVPSSGSTFYQPLKPQTSIASSLGRYDDGSRGQNYYSNPRAHTASPDSTRMMHTRAPQAPSSPASLRPPSQRHSRTSSLSPEFDIEVEPPSGPESVNSESAPMTPNLLRADNLPPMPSPAEQTEPVQQVPAQVMSMPGAIPPPLGHGSAPVVLTELPPGFQPIGPPMPQNAFPPMGGSFAGSAGPAGVPFPPSSYGGTPSVAGSNVAPNSYPATEPVIPHLMPTAAPSAGGQSAVRYSRTALRDSSSDSDDAVSSAMGSLDSLTTPPSRQSRLPKSPAPLYQEAPIPPNVVYPVPPTPRSASSRGTTAAKVPLPSSGAASVASPTSTAGYPYSQTSYNRSNIALDAGRTPLATNRPMSPLMGSTRGAHAPLPVQSPRTSPYDMRPGSPEDDLTRANTFANALPPHASPRTSTTALGSPVIPVMPEPSLSSAATAAKGKKGKKKKGK